MTFCTNCGSEIPSNGAFCASCGTRAPGTAQPPAVQQQLAAAPVKSGGLLKVLLVVFGVLFLIGVLAVAGVVYTGYRIKKSVEKAAQERGVDLSALTQSPSASRNIDPCSLLTKEEASQILAVAVERVQRSGESCQYFAPSAADNARTSAEEALAKLKARSDAGSRGEKAPSDANELARQSGLGDLVKSLGQAGAANGPYLTVTVNDNGKQAINALRIAMGLLSPVRTTEELQGLADEALLGPMDSMMMFVKNGVGVQMDLRLIPQGKARGIALAKQMAPRL